MLSRNTLLTATEIGMLMYWALALLLVLGVVSINPELMYSDYQNPLIVSWNWSFFPIDLIFSVTGLYARYYAPNPRLKLILSAVALSLMFCAGLMAISFWLLRAEFDWFWWAMNIGLMLMASWGLFGLLFPASATPTSEQM